LLIRDEDRAQERVDELRDHLLVFDSWYQFAVHLANDENWNFQTAYNKLKHGPAARVRNDVRMTLTEMDSMDASGRVRLSALTAPEAHDIIKSPIIEVLARAPRSREHVWEASQILLDTELMLSETFMIAWTHAAIYANAARRHFAGRELRLEGIEGPPFPGYPQPGTTPDRPHLRRQLHTFRIPLTVAAGSKTSNAKHVFSFRDRSWIPANFGPRQSGVVVDDHESP